MDVERIKYERTGGFTGMTISTDWKLGDLSPDYADQINELLDDLDFGELPERMIDQSGPDQFTYVITVETAKWEHTVVTGDVSAPAKMQELLQLLDRLARTKKKQ